MSLNSRKDDRSIKQFKKDIKLHTLKERFLIDLWAAQQKNKVDIYDNGTDNTGELQTHSTNAPDFKVVVNGKQTLLEVKNSPISSKWTLKTKDLKAYIILGASILIFWGTGYIENDPSKYNKTSTRYGIITTKKIQEMLDHYEHYQEYLFGGKMCIKVLEKDFSKWVTIKKIKE